jgi:hypothetical protein
MNLQYGDDDAEQSDSAAEDLNDQDLDEQIRLLRVRQSGTGPDNTDAHAAEQIGQSTRQTSTKHGKSCRHNMRTWCARKH